MNHPWRTPHATGRLTPLAARCTIERKEAVTEKTNHTFKFSVDGFHVDVTGNASREDWARLVAAFIKLLTGPKPR